MSIKVQDLLKKYGTQTAVNQISFEVHPGEIVGFLGPNGAGKSTTMKMITGYVQPDAGNIAVCGLNVADHRLESKKKIGYLPEANPLYYDMYVREYLHFIASVHQLSRKNTAIQNALHTVGLEPEAHKKIGQLSKGYKQRVGLAAALIHNPDVLILDEPTSGLDPNQIIEIRQVIRELAKTKTVLFSSHIMQEVEALCERVIIIHKGNLVVDESIQKLQQHAGKHPVVVVQFNREVEVALLQNLAATLSVQTVHPGTYMLETDTPEDTRKALLQFSVEHNLNIESLQSKMRDLESVFKSYTT
ncbi:MAG: gliding motility-associated ABC transporter ATP-binding subunit GldA [Ferruginibacter sp.]|nr:gliding motility-associated ABC transporter ATP-binding subunit GldA [Ferruginibacter sp.]